MKNKKEIKERIEKAKKQREKYNVGVTDDMWYKGYIKALKWVLEEEGEEK